MIDSETREALIAVCETLKAEFRYLASLQRALVGLYEAVKSEIPNVEARYREQAIQIREHPGTVEQIQLIDALQKQLEKQ